MAAVVSVIIPVYNAERYVREGLDSVLAQTYRGLEVICVDDGSTDGTAAILRDYASSDSRVRLVAHERSTAGAARNAGYALATGEYVIFLDADDVYAPTLIAELVSGLEETGADISVCRYALYRDGSARPSFAEGVRRTIENPARTVDLFGRWMGWSWDKLLRRSLIDRYALRFQEIPASNDLAFVFTALSLASVVCETDAVLILHRLHAGSIETKRDRSPMCGVEALRHYKRMADRWNLFEREPRLAASFRAYVPRFLSWYLYTLSDDAAYARLRDELPRAAVEFGVAKSWAWWWRMGLCRLKRPVRLLVRGREAR